MTNAGETPSAVRVTIETLPCPIPEPGTAGLAVRELTASLDADLGTRTVADANGQRVPLR